MMIRGGDPNNMQFGDTLSDDKFNGYTFQYCISNPPFGIDWKREKKAVEAEAAKGELGRFAPGLPKISDGQQLFVLNGLAQCRYVVCALFWELYCRHLSSLHLTFYMPHIQFEMEEWYTVSSLIKKAEYGHSGEFERHIMSHCSTVM